MTSHHHPPTRCVSQVICCPGKGVIRGARDPALGPELEGGLRSRTYRLARPRYWERIRYCLDREGYYHREWQLETLSHAALGYRDRRGTMIFVQSSVARTDFRNSRAAEPLPAQLTV
jgi:hypothetical protein